MGLILTRQALSRKYKAFITLANNLLSIVAKWLYSYKKITSYDYDSTFEKNLGIPVIVTLSDTVVVLS